MKRYASFAGLAVAVLALMAAPVAGVRSPATSGLSSSSWENLVPANEPSPRSGAGMTFDHDSNEILLFGGILNGENDETWLYDVANNTWTQMHPNVAPSPRSGPAMPQSSYVKNTPLFGGSTGSGETWLFNTDSRSWAQVFPPVSPPPRYGASMTAWHDQNWQFIMFGGSDLSGQVLYNDSWLFDIYSKTWKPLDMPGGPSPRVHATMVSDLSASKLVIFGGLTATGVSDETWILDPFSGKWTLSGSASRPSARHNASIAWDYSIKLDLLVGGSTGGDETWTYDVYADVWTKESLTSAPGDRFGHRIVSNTLDQFRSVYLFGGVQMGGEAKGTWLWKRGSPSNAPRVISTVPEDGATNVPSSKEIVIVFDRQMDEASTLAAITIDPPVTPDRYVSFGGASVEINNSRFSLDTTYTVTIGTGAKSAAGELMQSPYLFSFSTGSGPSERRELSGQVTDPSGRPVAGAIVEVHDASDGSMVKETTTGPDGRFLFSLPAGKTYYLVVRYPDGSTSQSPPAKLDSNREVTVQKVAAPPPPPWTLLGVTVLAVAGIAAASLLLIRRKTRGEKTRTGRTDGTAPAPIATGVVGAGSSSSSRSAAARKAAARRRS